MSTHSLCQTSFYLFHFLPFIALLVTARSLFNRAIPLSDRRSFEVRQFRFKLKWESNWKSQLSKRSLSFVYVRRQSNFAFIWKFVRRLCVVIIVDDFVSSCCILLYVYASTGFIVCLFRFWLLSANSFFRFYFIRRPIMTAQFDKQVASNWIGENNGRL